MNWAQCLIDDYDQAENYLLTYESDNINPYMPRREFRIAMEEYKKEQREVLGE